MSADETQEKALAAGCPHAARAASLSIRTESPSAPVSPELFTINQVETLMAAGHPLAVTAAWMRRFLARPHRELGRPGPVCPFVPGAIVQDTIWLADCSLGRGDRQAIVEIIGLFREMFLTLEPKSGDAAGWKAMVIVFPNVPVEDADVIDSVQSELKARFVDAGLMIGEFHERNESPGLRNGDFRPLRSPIPALAIRHMVETDLPFLHRTLYPPPLRAEFIRSYLRRLGGSISRNNFDAALDALVRAEIEIREEVTA